MLDDYCKSTGIERVDLLKSDTQGSELEVFVLEVDGPQCGVPECGAVFSEEASHPHVLGSLEPSRPVSSALPPHGKGRPQLRACGSPGMVRPVWLSIRARLRPLAVHIVRRVPAGPLLRARRRFDRALTEGQAQRPPRTLRLARLRPVPAGVSTFEPPGWPGVRLVNSDSFETQLLYWLGLDECTFPCAGIRLWEALCSRSDSVVEIGAHLGVYAVCGARVARGRYRAFEPHPASAQALRANLAENGLDRVEVIEAAVVPDEWREPIRLTVPTGRDESTPSGASVAAAGHSGLDVAAFPASAAIEDCDLLKIDVEGLESALLGSCLAALTRFRPLVMVEVLDDNTALRAMLPELVAVLDGQTFAMRRASLVPVDPAAFRRTGSLQAAYATWDYLIVPAQKADRVAALVRGRDAISPMAGDAG